MKRKRVLVLGSTGMVGSGISAALKDKCDLVLTSTKMSNFDYLEDRYGSFKDHIRLHYNVVEPLENLQDASNPVDMVINCIGAIARGNDKNTLENAWRLNIDWPIELADFFGDKVVHISTDCVFDGTEGPYDESSCPTPSYGSYGYSKLFGEIIQDYAKVLRCCVIGEAVQPHSNSLLDWFRHCSDDEVWGYTKWYSSPVTSIELGNICFKILNNPDFPQVGLFHLAAERVSKFDILTKYKELRKLSCHIIPESPSFQQDKTLIAQCPSLIKIPSFDKMLTEMIEDY